MGTQLPQKGTAPIMFSPYLLRPNGCMDQNVTWYGGRPRPRRLCLRLWTAKNSTPNAPELTFLAQKSKKSGEGHRPLPTAHHPRRRLRLWRLDPMALDLCTFRTSAVPRPPDFAPSFPHTFRRLCPGRKSHRAKLPGSENSRE